MGKLTYTTPQVQAILDGALQGDTAIKSSNGKVQKIIWDLTNFSEFITGELHYDPIEKTFSFLTELGQNIQINKEQFQVVRNHNAYPLLEGRLIRIVGFNGTYFTVDYADYSNKETASWDGMLTTSIPAYTGLNDDVCIGSMTTNGFVNGIDTTSCNGNNDVYLTSQGQWSCIKPSGKYYIRHVGKIGIGNSVDGSIYVRWSNETIGDVEQALIDSGMPHGIPASQKTIMKLRYDSTLRTVTILNPHYYYFKSVKVIIPHVSQTINHADTAGTYYLCYTESGLSFTTTPFVFGECVPIAIVIYNNASATTFWSGPDGKILDERHGCIMDKATHKELHETVGCYATTGFGAAGYTQATGTGGLTANSYSIDSGNVNDEDLATLLPSLPDNNGVGNNYKIYYKSGNKWRWYKNNLPYLFEATNIEYNQITAGSGALTQITNNGYYMNTYVVGIPELDTVTGLPTNEGIAIILGQAQYTSLALAQAESIISLDLSGFPGPELAPLHQITWQRQSSYDDNGNCRIESFRRIVGTKLSLATGGASPSIHGNLAGRNDADQHIIGSVTGLQDVLDSKVVGPASSIDNSIPVFDGITGKLLKDNTGVNIVSGNVVGNNSLFIISTDSSDGADNKRLQIGGGGGASISRGGFIELIGNEYSTFGGNVNIVSGDGIQGKIGFYTGAANEKMRLEKGGNLGIGSGAIGTALGKLDISNGSIALVLGADSNAETRTDNTLKVARICSPHYLNAEEPVSIITAFCDSNNTVNVGGGSGAANAATIISFYTAANTTTVTGTERMRINSSGQVGMGTLNPITGSRLDISDGSLSLNIGADIGLTTRTNLTSKVGRITSMHYVNAEEPLALIQGFSDASTNIVNIGGGTSAANTATATVIYAAANTTTLTGTEIARFNTTGLGIGTNNPSEKLHVIGNIRSSAEVHAGTKVVIASKVEQVYDSVNKSLKFNFL